MTDHDKAPSASNDSALPLTSTTSAAGSHRHWSSRLWRFTADLLFCLWWGGLTFYAAVVIPIATESMGAETQGFVTQQVTRWLNALTTVWLLMVAVDAVRHRSHWRWSLWTVLALCQIGLFVDHARLTSLMDFSTQAIAIDRARFYAEHQVYLWITVIQWLAGLLWLAYFSRYGSRELDGADECRCSGATGSEASRR